MSWKTGKTRAAALVVGGIAFTGAADAQLKAIKTQTNISPAERRQGDEAHPQLLQEFGGAYKGPQVAGAPAASNSGARPSTRASWALRSEEHTSELQSLMRISYAVFGLKKKKLHLPQHE